MLRMHVLSGMALPATVIAPINLRIRPPLPCIGNGFVTGIVVAQINTIFHFGQMRAQGIKIMHFVLTTRLRFRVNDEIWHVESSRLDTVTTSYFSFRTPLNGLLSAFWSMNRPVPVSRLTHRSFWGLNTWLLSRTAPIRCPSPLGGFVAISNYLFERIEFSG